MVLAGRSGLVQRVEEDLSAIGRDSWEGLSHDWPQLSYDWLQARSRTIKGRPRFVYVSAGDGRPMLGLAAYLVGGTSHPGYDPAQVLAASDLPEADVAALAGGGRALSGLRNLLRRAPSPLHPALVVAAPGRSPGLSYRSGLDDAARAMAVEAAADALEGQAADDAATTICWLYLLEGEDQVLDRVLAGRGYRKLVIGADCYLPITWQSFDGYLGGFRSQRRKQIRREMAALVAADVRVEMCGADALDGDLARLELEWRHKYQRQASYESTLADYAELRRHLASGLRVFIASRAGRPLGFSVFLEHRGTWYGRFGGFDYQSKKLFLYFNLLFYRPIQAALERQISCIRYSLLSYEEKRSRGCSLHNMLAYVRPPRSVAEVVASGLEAIDLGQRSRLARIAAMHSKHA